MRRFRPTILATVFALTGLPAMAGQYPVVDTGQTACYDNTGEIACPPAGDAFHGQDAQHTGNVPAYRDNLDGTVTDLVTWLMWQQSADLDGDGDIDADDKLTYSEATAYPDALNARAFAGYTDWRLPTIKETYSLIDFSGVDPSGYEGTDSSGLIPFIDTEYFDFAYGDIDAGERIIDSQWASSSLYVADPNMLFGVNFADGRIKGYGLTMPFGGGEKTFFVICVRGNPSYGVNDFVDNGDGTVTDAATGLMWSQGDSGDGLDWQGALAWVEARNAEAYLGHDDWRLPNAKELQSILDYTRSPDTTSSAAIDPVFDATSITNEAGQTDYPSYWSSTTHSNWTSSPGAAGAYLSFGRAMGYMNGSWRDVHGAGAQRSDPKQGDPADWPTGHGPQGDAIRIDNLVRLVRTTDAGDSTDLSDLDLAIPAVARVKGSHAFFTTRLEVFNASADLMLADVLYTPRTDLGGSPIIVSIALAAGQMVTVSDVLGRWFDIGDEGDAVGSLIFSVSEGSAEDLMISSVITATGDDGSEYGQAFPATAAGEALSAGETAYLSTTVDGGGTRVNFGAMAWDDETVLEVRPVDPADTALADPLTTTLDFGESLQFNGIANTFSLGGAEDYLLEATVTAGSAVVYASVLDGDSNTPGTSDPTTIRPVTTGAETVTLLELGPVAGYDDFSGSASISNLSDTTAQIEIDFHTRETSGVAATASLDIPIGDTVGYDDIVGELFGMNDVGTVVIRSLNGAELTATGREFAYLFDDEGEYIGTAGQLIPGMTDDELATPGTIYHLLGLRQNETVQGRERSHLAAFNPGEDPVALELALFDGLSGAAEGTTTITVEAGELVQTNNIISVIDADQNGAPKRIEFTTEGELFVKAFRVNPTGDPVTIDALAETGVAATISNP